MNAIALSDNELIARYVEGDESALKSLIVRHQKKVFSYIMLSVKNRELAEDIFQDTFIKVINTLKIYGTDPSAEEKIITEQIYAEVQQLIKLLPDEQREVLEMRIYQDISFKDISAITGVSINTALGRMRYALINLRKIIKEKNLILS